MDTQKKLDLILELLEEKKAIDVCQSKAPAGVLLDYFVVCTGSSVTHLKTIYDFLKVSLKEKGIKMYGVEGNNDKNSGWMVVDTSDVVVHILSEEKRKFYDLERLWKEYLEGEDE